MYPLGIPALYSWHLHRNRAKIDPDLPPIEGETPEALQMRKIKAREADKSLRHLFFLFEERGPASTMYVCSELGRLLALVEKVR